jgi:hypothetical protein
VMTELDMCFIACLSAAGADLEARWWLLATIYTRKIVDTT